MNLLYITIGDESITDRDERVSEWRKRNHIVEPFPAERLVSYLRFGESSTLACIDAIVCDADTQQINYFRGIPDPEFRVPLWRAMQLAEAMRCLPENCAMRDGRTWKSIPFVVFANPLEYESPVQYPASLATILPPYCNGNPSWALARIRECVDRYHDRLFREYQSVGIPTRINRGHAQIGPLKKPKINRNESAYYSAAMDRRDHKGWVTVKRDDEGVRDDVEVFQQLLDRNATEPELHAFLEQHPALLMESMLGIPLSHKPNFIRPRNFKPDFALSPILGPLDENSIELLELKRPKERLLTGRLHRGFTASVHRAIDQVRDYDRYLRDPINLEAILKALRYFPERSKLAILIGRTPNGSDSETLALRGREVNVQIVTYDLILETQASQIRGLLQ